jgi:group I intron endonuclease
MPCIYKITSQSGKSYIGQTVRPFSTRVKDHKKSSSNCRLLRRAITKYGWSSMKTEILLYCDESSLDMYEEAMIKAYDTLCPNGYNLTSGGETRKRLSQESKQKIREASIRNKTHLHFTPEAREKSKATNRLPEIRKQRGEQSRRAWNRKTPEERAAIMKKTYELKYGEEGSKYNGLVKPNKYGFVAYAHPKWVQDGKRYVGSFKTEEEAWAHLKELKSRVFS